LMREQTRGNPFTYGAYLLSQLDGSTPITYSHDTTPNRRYSSAPRIDISGNPIGSALKKLFRDKSEAYLAAIADPPPAHPLNSLTFPQPGLVHDGLLAVSRGEYALQLFGDRFIRNGTRIAELVNPTLTPGEIPGAGGYTIRCSAPLSPGRYPAAWSVAPPSDIIEASPSALLFCASAECRGRDITLYDLPYVLPKPENKISFTLYHATRLPQTDTLTFIWCIRYTDRSSERASHSYSVGTTGTVGMLREFAGPVFAAPYAVINSAGERCLILPIRVQGDKDIFRVDAFVHSLVKNEIVGWGSASCRG
jgi:hypothetical protein